MSQPQERKCYLRCRFCFGTGCLACDGERRKDQKREAEIQAKRIENLKSQTPEEILSSLPQAKTGVLIAARFSGESLTDEEVDQRAREIILKNLADGGHEFPSSPILTRKLGISPVPLDRLLRDFKATE